jgi:hypothetical protein
MSGTVSFSSLYQQYTTFGPRACLAIGKQGVIFTKRPSSCISRFFQQLWYWISFRAEASAASLIGRATSVIKEGNLKKNEEELTSLIKVIQVSKTILEKVKKKPSRQAAANRLINESQLKMDEAARLLAASRGISTVEFYLSIGLGEEAYLSLSRKDDIARLSKEQLTLMLPFAKKHSDYELLRKLAARGIPIKENSTYDLQKGPPPGSVSFSSLYQQCKTFGPKACLAIGKQGVLFTKRPSNCIVRLFLQIWRKISFRAEDSAAALIKRAVSVIKENNLKRNDEELSSLIKVIQISKTILEKVSKKPQRYDDANCLIGEGQMRMDEAAKLLAASRGVSVVELYLSMGLKEEAYLSLSKMGDISALSNEQLEQLFPFAKKYKDFELLGKLAARGFPMKDFSVNEMHQITVAALKNSSDEASLRSILHSGLTLNTSEDALDILFPAISQGHIKSVKALLEKKAKFTVKDANDNTALHKAFLSGNSAMVQLFFPLVDPRLKNKDGQTALMMALHPSHRYLLPESNKKNFLAKILTPPSLSWKRVSSSGFSERLTTLFPGIEFPPCDPVELAYLINDPVLFMCLKKRITRESFIESCETLAAKYPHKSFEQFQRSIFSLTKAHYKTGYAAYKVPKTAPPIPLESIFTLFDQVDWKKEEFDPIRIAKKIGRGISPFTEEKMVAWLDEVLPQYVSNNRVQRKIREKMKAEVLKSGGLLDKEKAIDCLNESLTSLVSSSAIQNKIVDALRKHIFDKSLAYIKKMIQKFISNIETKAEISDVPHGERARTEFYDLIKREVLYVCDHLQKNPDAKLAHNVLKDFAVASGLCGGRYNYVAANKYFLVCEGMEETPMSLFLRRIADFRKTCLEEAVAFLYGKQEHSVHGYNLAVLDLGEKLGIPGFADPFDKEKYTVTGYDPVRIEQKFHDIYSIDSIIDDWIWPSVEEDSLFQKQYKKLQIELMPKVEKKPPTEDEKYTYLQTVIHDEETFALRKEALLYLLERLGIIKTDVKWEDHSKKIEPVIPSDSNLFRKIQRFVMKKLLP